MKFVLLTIGALLLNPSAGADLPEPSAQKLPQWRGFNLQNLYWDRGREFPFKEEDFEIISGLGFNFLRIPVSYRLIANKDRFHELDPERLKVIDQVIEWGGKHGLHICLNLFQVPGYCVTPEPDPWWPSVWNLWEDEEPQEIFAGYWKTLAARYRGVPNRNLSFNLINENHWDTPASAYARVMRRAIDAVRSEDAGRLMIVDGLKTASQPCWELADAGVAQALHFYKPMELTHYGADWLDRPLTVKPQQWPMPLISKHLYGPRFPFRTPVAIRGPFIEPHRLTIDIREVVASESIPLTVCVEADGRIVSEKRFAPGADSGGLYLEEYGVYVIQGVGPLEADIPAGTQRVVVEVREGDRLLFDRISLLNVKTGQRHDILPILEEWESRQSPLHYDAEKGIQADEYMDREWLRRNYIEPFKELEARGVGLMVMEFGCYSRTPHDIALRWMDDALSLFEEAGWGWALWEWNGSFGPIDSGRADAEYDEIDGRMLDRRMMERLLQRKGEKKAQ